MSAIVGSKPVASLINKPIKLSLASKTGQSDGTSMSFVNFPMNIGLQSTPGYSAAIGIESMTFYNTFSNIVDGKNRLKVLSSYINSAGVTINNIISVVIPSGHYDIDALLTFLNDPGVCNYQDDDDFYYGLGDFDDPTYPAFSKSELYPSHLEINFPTYGKGASALGQYDVDHVYLYFGLIVDDETQGLMEQLGLLDYNLANQISNTENITLGGQSYNGLFAKVANQGLNSYYNYGPTYVEPGTAVYVYHILADNIFYLGGPDALMIGIEQISTPNRISTTGLDTSNVVGIVPINSGYGSKTVYFPSFYNPTLIGDLSISNIQISIKDASDGRYVDFQNSPWILVLTIQFIEVSEKQVSDIAAQGLSTQNVFTPFKFSEDGHGANKRFRSLQKNPIMSIL